MRPIAREAEGFGGERVRIKYTFSSSNRKTGDMIQQWITPSAWEGQGTLTRRDLVNSQAACKDCPLLEKCYVKKGMAGMGLRSSSRSVTHDTIHETAVLDKFLGRFVRFGAFGEPVLAGERATREIAEVASGWTGYTHRWREDEYDWAKQYFMASVETHDGMLHANERGYRTFRVGKSLDDMDSTKEILCPASKEAGSKLTCKQCGLCKGASLGAKNIFIVQH